MKLREKVWLWGQTAGGHHVAAYSNLPGVNKMTPIEGARYFGIPNMCRVALSRDADIFTEEEAKTLDECERTVWSIFGAGGGVKESATFENILKLRKTHKNIVGGVLDDFFSPERMAVYTPLVLADIRKMLSPLELWVVTYEYEQAESLKEYFIECDKISFWTWYGENLGAIRENIEKLKNFIGRQKSILQGVYMYDYGNNCPLSDDAMHAQLAVAYDLLKKGETEGIILCSNCIADIGLAASDIMKDWMDRHGDEEI